jgi:LTXXQ motif family protein
MAESQQKRMPTTGQAEWTLPQWVELHLQMMEEHLAAMKKIKPALDALYQALSPEQRQKADQLIRMG